MGFRAVRLILVVAIILTCLPAAVSYGQENAVGGSVRTKKDNIPIEGVEVIVVQMPSIKDVTRAEDAVYVLPIPKSLKKFHLRYKHQNYLEATDEDITNEQGQNKRPIVKMRSNKVAELSTASEEEIAQVVADSKRMIRRGLYEEVPALVDAGKSNLDTLENVAGSLSDEARSFLKSGDTARAERQYEKSIAFYTNVNPRSEKLARTLDEYAALLNTTNRKEKANALATRATTIRRDNRALFEFTQRQDLVAHRQDFYERRKAAIAMLSTANNYEALQFLQDLIEGESADKFALENANNLPNFEQVIVPLFSGQQYGRLEIPAGKVSKFKVYAHAGTAPRIRALNSSTNVVEVSVSDERGAEVGKAMGFPITWEAKKTGTYTITLSNKTSTDVRPVLNLSLDSQRIDRQRSVFTK